MKRDWELIRNVLCAIEDIPAGDRLSSEEIDSDDHALVLGHISMLKDAGFLNAEVLQFMDGTGQAFIHGMTFSGHDLLDTIRNDTMWSGIKTTAKSKGLDLTFDVVKGAGKMVLEHILSGKPILGIS